MSCFQVHEVVIIPQILRGSSMRTSLAFPFSSVRQVPQLFITYASLAEEALANIQGEYCDTHHKVGPSRKEYQGSNDLFPWGFCGLFYFLSLLERHQAKYSSKAAAFLLEAWSQIMSRVLGNLMSVNSAAAEGIWHLWVSVTLWGCGRQHCTVDALVRPLQPPCQRALGFFARAQCSTQLCTQQLMWLRGEGMWSCVGLKKTLRNSHFPLQPLTADWSYLDCPVSSLQLV